MKTKEKWAWQKSDKNPSKNPVRREQIRQEKLGKKLSEQQKRKISRSMKKALKDPVLIEKWRKAATERVFSPETLEKIRMTKAKKPKTVKTLKSNADTVFSRYIRLRDSKNDIGICITCGQSVGANGKRNGQAGHFMSRRYNSTRYDEKNVHLQCAGCNMWGAGEQYKYSLAIDKRYGKGTADKLFQKAHMVHKFTPDELKELIQCYKDKTIKLLDKA